MFWCFHDTVFLIFCYAFIIFRSLLLVEAKRNQQFYKLLKNWFLLTGTIWNVLFVVGMYKAVKISGYENFIVVKYYVFLNFFFFFLTNQFCPILMGQNWPVFTFRLEYLLLSFFGIKYIIKVGWSCTMVECALWTFPVKENLFIKLQICCNPVFKNPLSNLIDLILKNTSCSEKQAY